MFKDLTLVSCRARLITWQHERFKVASWLIRYRGADRIERDVVASADERPTEQRAAMIVSESLYNQSRATIMNTDGVVCMSPPYNFEILSIIPAPVEPGAK